jgi:TonB family protein
MAVHPEERHETAKAHRARVRERLLYIGELRELWHAVSDQDFEQNYRTKYFGDYRIARFEALDLLDRWEQEILDRSSGAEEISLRILWEVPPIQVLMWRHLQEFFVQEAPTVVPRPITAMPASAENVIVREHFPSAGVLLALAVQISLLFITINPVTQRAFQKLDQLTQDHTITYYKISEYLPEVFSPEAEKELPKTAKIIPKRKQTIISNPPNPDNEFQTIIQPDAPKATNLAEIKLPNIISVKPQVVRPAEPPLPTLAPGSMSAMNLPKDLLIPISPALPPKADVAQRALSDIKVAESEALNPAPRLLLKPNADVPDVKPLPPTTFGNTFANVPVPKGPDAVPTVTPEIGRFAKVDMPNLVVLNVNPAPPEKEVKVPNVSRAASFGTEEGNGEGGGGAKAGALNIPGIAVQGGGFTEPGAAVVQTQKLPEQIASNIPPKDRAGAGSRTQGARGQEKPRELNFPKPRRFSTEESLQSGPLGSTEGAKKNPLREGEREKKIYTTYLNLSNLSSQSGSWVMRFSEYEDPTLTASRQPVATDDPGAELSAPRLIHSEHPRYPPSAIYEKVEGNVILMAVIRQDGSVDNIKVNRSADERLDAAAIEALKRWLFHPSRKNGKPVDVLAEITIPFSLKKMF